jgi:hypothetical protein
MGMLGYVPIPCTEGKLVRNQETWSRAIAADLTVLFDLHWKVSEPVFFARLISFEELRADACQVPPLGRHALRPSDLHCALIACIHRVAHHHDGDDLIWLYDLRILLDGKGPHWLTTFAALSRQKGVNGICGHGLKLARRACGARFDEEVFARSFCSETARKERSAAFLIRGRAWSRDLLDDLRALPSWRDRARLLCEHAFPPAAFVLARYGVRERWRLPFLYARRIVVGLGKLARPRPDMGPE